MRTDACPCFAALQGDTRWPKTMLLVCVCVVTPGHRLTSSTGILAPDRQPKEFHVSSHGRGFWSRPRCAMRQQWPSGHSGSGCMHTFATASSSTSKRTESAACCPRVANSGQVASEKPGKTRGRIGKSTLVQGWIAEDIPPNLQGRVHPQPIDLHIEHREQCTKGNSQGEQGRRAFGAMSGRSGDATASMGPSRARALEYNVLRHSFFHGAQVSDRWAVVGHRIHGTARKDVRAA